MKNGRGFFLFRWGDLFRRREKVLPDGRANDQKFTAHDILAIVLAVLSIVVPWVLAIMAALALILFLVTRFFLR